MKHPKSIHKGAEIMETCHFIDFMQVFKPWLNRDYIRKAYVDANGDLRFMFNDGGEKVFRIYDCSQKHLDEIIQELIENNVPVEKHDSSKDKQANCSQPLHPTKDSL
jgi:hypothetical protein